MRKQASTFSQSNADHSIDFIIDGRRISVLGQNVVLKIDGRSVYKHSDGKFSGVKEERDIGVSAMRSFLTAAMASFGNKKRFEIVTYLSSSSKTFSEIKEMLNVSPPTTNHHLKRLIKNLIVFKDRDGKYSLTVLGELILDYFSKFLNEEQNLQKIVAQE